MTATPKPITLFALPQSPYCAKVRAVLRYKAIAYEEHEPAGGSYQTTEYQQTVPAGSVPAIQLENYVLHDSQAIVEFLEETYPDPSVWSADPQLRAKQRSLVHYHDSKLEPVTRELVAHARQPAEQLDRHELNLISDRIFDRLFRLEKMVEATPWMLGDEPSMADWTYPGTLAIAMALADHLHIALELPGALSGWYVHASNAEPALTEVERVKGAIHQWLSLDSGWSQMH